MLFKWFRRRRADLPAPIVAQQLLGRWENGKMIPGHLEDYRDWMLAKGRTPKHTAEVYSRARKVIRLCRWRTIADVRAQTLEMKVAKVLRESRGKSLKTCNDYLKAPAALTRWMASPKVGRALTNPLSDVEKYNPALDVRHPRRPLTREQFLAVLRSIHAHNRTIRRMTASHRAMYYLLKLQTGLRNEEAASLRPESFDLASDPPVLRVQACYSKHRRLDVVPLDRDFARDLAAWLADKPSGQNVFPIGDKPYLMWRSDLTDAGYQYRDERGFADLYALRHTFATELGRSGESMRVVQRLMRHVDIRQTERYMHVDNADELRALSRLPRPPQPKPEGGQ